MSEHTEMNVYVFHALWDTGDKTSATMMLFQSPSASAARERGIRLLGLVDGDRLIAATIIETSQELADALRQRGLAMHTADAPYQPYTTPERIGQYMAGLSDGIKADDILRGGK